MKIKKVLLGLCIVSLFTVILPLVPLGDENLPADPIPWGIGTVEK